MHKVRNTPEMLTIARVDEEARGIKSFTFRHNLGAQPGQFVMVWFPGLNQKPMSVGYSDEKEFMLTIAAVGSCSEAICALQVGDRLGIQGPYGTSYTIPKGKRVAMVAGGYGAAPLYFAGLECLKKDSSVEYILGARAKELLIYQKRLPDSGMNIHLMTNDGSVGEKGFATDKLEALLKDKKVDHVMTCGPELMQKRVVDLCVEYNISCQVSLERYMKCGFGVCGSCCVDDGGQTTCVEGPVLNKEAILNVAEFGKYHRDAAGTRHSFL